MKPRPAHILKSVTGKSLPKNVIFFDTETSEVRLDDKRVELVLKLGVAILTRRDRHNRFQRVDECRFYDVDTFTDWLTSVIKGKEKYYIVAHNIAFDIRVVGLLKYFSSHKWKRTMLIAEGVNFIASFRKDTTTVQLVNNQQLFNVSLKKLGEAIGVYKKGIDFAAANDTELLEYCVQDVVVMIEAWNFWVKYISDNDLGPFRLTAASQAMSAFRHRFLDETVYIHNDERTIKLERESYHGGRVECFYIGTYSKGLVYNLDVNSMYPAMMESLPVPVKLLKYYERCPREVFERNRRNYGYIVEAALDISEAVLPVKDGKRLLFPTGRVVGVFTKPEYEAALEVGNVREVFRCAFYDERVAFHSFVDFFYTARLAFREAGNDQFAYISKLLLNSLYGKFGQKQNVYETVGKSINTPDGIYKSLEVGSGEWVKYRIIEGIVEKSVGFEEGYNSFVAVASYITAAARVLLAKYIRIAGRENVLYCDTDSLFVNATGHDLLADYIDASALGKLKLVQNPDTLTIFGPKWYRFGDTTKLKGIRHNARRVGEYTYEQDKFLSFAGGLRSYHTNSVIIERVTKKLSRDYLKGELQPDGRVLPFELT